MSLSESLPCVVLVGGANLDVVGRPARSMVPRDSNPGRIRFSFGGVARNIAENLARLEVPAELIAGLGSGPEGQLIRNYCLDSGIGMESSVDASSGTASTYLALCDMDGDMAWAVSDMSAAAAVNPDILENRRQLLEKAAIIVADTNISIESLAYLTESFPSIPLYVDPVSTTKARKLSGLLSGIHTLKLNRLEAEAVSGLKVDSRDDIPAIARELRKAGVTRTIITLGANLIYWNNEDEEGFLEPDMVDTVDATGAGDAFFAGVILGDLLRAGMNRTLRYGAAAASLAVQSESAVNPALSRSALEKMIAG